MEIWWYKYTKFFQPLLQAGLGTSVSFSSTDMIKAQDQDFGINARIKYKVIDAVNLGLLECYSVLWYFLKNYRQGIEQNTYIVCGC